MYQADRTDLIEDTRELLVATLNNFWPRKPLLTEGYGDPIRYRGSVQGFSTTIHVMTFDEDPPFDVWAFENDSGEILQVAWVADGYIALSPDEVN